MSHVILICKICDGTGKKPNGDQCMCYLFGGPIKRFDGDLWKVGEERVKHD